MSRPLLQRTRLLAVDERPASDLPTAMCAGKIDYPRAGHVAKNGEFEIVGWAVGDSLPIRAVEIVQEGHVVSEMPMTPGRHDVSVLYADSAQGDRVSFRGRVQLQIVGTTQLRVRAVLEDGRRVEFASVTVASEDYEPAPIGSAFILVYHRVVSLAAEPWRMSVAPEHFEEHLQLLCDRYQPIRLTEIGAGISTGIIPEGAVAVTFDDGYADNLHNALPLLEKYQVPATVFVTSGFVGQGGELWWDLLDRILLSPGSLPKELSLRIGGHQQHWALGKDCVYSESQAELHKEWKTGSGDLPTFRHDLYLRLWQLLIDQNPQQISETVSDILEWSRYEPIARPTHRSLTFAELTTLAESKLIDLGAHTETHPNLARLESEQQRSEIKASKSFLTSFSTQPIYSFSYPFGQKDQYSEDTVEIVQQEGFQIACINQPGLVGPMTDPFRLPRVTVPDCSGEQLAEQLASWSYSSQ